MATYGLPKSEKMLAALGRIALRHSQLDNALKMIVKDLVGVTKEEALDATAKQMSGELRGRVRKLAIQRLGECSALVKLDALLQRAQRATDRRNDWFHKTWGTEKASTRDTMRVVIRDASHTFQKAPTVKELMALVEELEILIDDIISARDGFLFEALKKKLLTSH